ncbi:MAG: ATP-binding cassette domain-containing protein [Acidimicrobiaceae bacterium]|nr:ATP-binding cassette domain-containing protein [Acidimicrobiaceae bacterium]
MGESETPAAVVEFDEVSRRFSDTLALDSVSFTVRQGEFFSIIGPSGSGKTTTVRMIAGLEAPTVGTVKLFGKDVSAVPPPPAGHAHGVSELRAVPALEHSGQCRLRPPHARGGQARTPQPSRRLAGAGRPGGAR